MDGIAIFNIVIFILIGTNTIIGLIILIKLTREQRGVPTGVVPTSWDDGEARRGILWQQQTDVDVEEPRGLTRSTNEVATFGWLVETGGRPVLGCYRNGHLVLLGCPDLPGLRI